MDEDIVEPLSLMFAFLTEKRDRKLTQQWGIWLTKRDPERALKVIIIILYIDRANLLTGIRPHVSTAAYITRYKQASR